MNDGQRPEFSRRVDADRVGTTASRERISATEAERHALARRMGLVVLHRLDARLTLERRQGGLIRVDGAIAAEVEEICVVTLEPFVSTVQDDFTLFFQEPGENSRPTGAADIDAFDDEAWPEPIDGGTIDLGEAVAQQLSLALDPHPRAPGAVVDAPAEGDGDRESDNPFRNLAAQLSGSKEKG